MLDCAGGSSCVTSFALTNRCSWQQDQAHTASFAASTPAFKQLLPITMSGNGSQTKSSQQQDLSIHSACQHDMHAMLRDAQQLLKAAEQVMRQSCQEDWLLQPYIPKIEEYRCVQVLSLLMSGRTYNTSTYTYSESAILIAQPCSVW